MKKVRLWMLTAILTLCGTTTVSAQTKQGEWFSSGSIGVGLSNFVGDIKDNKSKVGITLNGDIGYNVTDWFAPSTMTSYFVQLYCRRQTFDKKQIKALLYNPKDMNFEIAAENFKLIDDASIPVIVNWGDSMELIAKLKQEGPSYQLMKKLGQYTVNIRQNDFKTLLQAGQVVEVIERIYVIEDKAQYDDKVGLLTDNHWLEETCII